MEQLPCLDSAALCAFTATGAISRAVTCSHGPPAVALEMHPLQAAPRLYAFLFLA